VIKFKVIKKSNELQFRIEIVLLYTYIHIQFVHALLRSRAPPISRSSNLQIILPIAFARSN